MTDERTLRTPRLRLRQLRAGDFDAFYTSLVADPAVMRFYHAYRDLDDTEARRARAKRDFFDHFAAGTALGYVAWGLWPAPSLDAEPEQLLGWCGITTPALSDPGLGPEVQYMLGSRWQGKGLATEAARAVVNDAFARLPLARIHAVADAPNAASRRVIEQLGFAFDGPVEVYGSSDMVVYTMDRDAWTRRPAVIAETSRLRIRHLTPEDAPFIFELVNDPAWLRFIGDRNVHSLEDARGYIKGAVESYTRLGFGLYLVELRASGEPLGMCGLLKRDYLEDPDIGFAFLPRHTGQGYAQEAAATVIDHGRALGMRRILAIANQDNHASTRLLHKVGFSLQGRVVPPGEEKELNLFTTRAAD
ncbi:MAG TPA: GNAT family N-acetyltransferase [Steroidobacteraceae bacterium]|nr:GNAT family N-acetyltransferase [Steroidobacteraceae bacterium]